MPTRQAYIQFHPIYCSFRQLCIGKGQKNTAMLFTHSDVLFNIPIIQLLYQSAYYYEGTHLIRTQMHLTSAPHLTKDNTSHPLLSVALTS